MYESLFVCDKCGNIDMLTLVRTADAMVDTELLCTCCLPSDGSKPGFKKGGEWHGLFPQEKYEAGKHKVINRPS